MNLRKKECQLSSGFLRKKRYIISNNARAALWKPTGVYAAFSFHRRKKFLIRTLDCVPLPRNDKAINHRVFLAFSGSSVNRRLPWFLSINQIRSSDTRITINFNCFNKTRRGIRRINLRFNEKNFRRRALFCRYHFFASSEDSSLRGTGYSSRDEFLTRDEGNSVSKICQGCSENSRHDFLHNPAYTEKNSLYWSVITRAHKFSFLSVIFYSSRLYDLISSPQIFIIFGNMKQFCEWKSFGI